MYVDHNLKDLLAQSLYQICQGYEDADDCDHLRLDPALQAAVGRHPGPDSALASQPTMTRLENQIIRKDLVRFGYALCGIFPDRPNAGPYHDAGYDYDPYLFRRW